MKIPFCTIEKLNYPRLEGEGFSIDCRLEVDFTYQAFFVRHSCASRNPGSLLSVLDSGFASSLAGKLQVLQTPLVILISITTALI
jgi:hypothetical protein